MTATADAMGRGRWPLARKGGTAVPHGPPCPWRAGPGLGSRWGVAARARRKRGASRLSNVVERDRDGHGWVWLGVRSWGRGERD